MFLRLRAEVEHSKRDRYALRSWIAPRHRVSAEKQSNWKVAADRVDWVITFVAPEHSEDTASSHMTNKWH